MQGKEANISKAQNLSGRHGRICGGHKREGKCALPGEVCSEQRAEVSRSHSKPRGACTNAELGRRAERKMNKVQKD
jgi:hypothetical protein